MSNILSGARERSVVPSHGLIRRRYSLPAAGQSSKGLPERIQRKRFEPENQAVFTELDVNAAEHLIALQDLPLLSVNIGVPGEVIRVVKFDNSVAAGFNIDCNSGVAIFRQANADVAFSR